MSASHKATVEVQKVEFLGDQRFGVSEHQDHRKGKSGARRIRDDFSYLESARTSGTAIGHNRQCKRRNPCS